MRPKFDTGTRYGAMLRYVCTEALACCGLACRACGIQNREWNRVLYDGRHGLLLVGRRLGRLWGGACLRLLEFGTEGR